MWAPNTGIGWLSWPPCRLRTWFRTLSRPYLGAVNARGYEQEVVLGDDLRVKEVRRSLVGGARPALLWSVQLDEHDGASGQQIPRLLHLVVPGRRTEVDLRLRDLLVGKPPPANAFALLPPPGIPVRELP